MTTRAFLAVIAAVQLAARPAMAQTTADKDNAHHYRGGPKSRSASLDAACPIGSEHLVRTRHDQWPSLARSEDPTTWVRKSKIAAAPAATSHVKIAADGQSQMSTFQNSNGFPSASYLPRL